MMFTPPLLRSRKRYSPSPFPRNIKFVEARQSRHINIILRRQPSSVSRKKKVLKGYHPAGRGSRPEQKCRLHWYRVVSREEPAILQSMPQARGLLIHRISSYLAEPYRQMIQETGLAVYHAMICRPLGYVDC
ncbi:hypothetical protein FJTKL_08284 [Diaporthe vaccinii]|uniref:Uncharacterized protein n=1 Tax=Diaporthe vaccinii TaxID=105482 RepID=A0ABR4ESE6_9PEZI